MQREIKFRGLRTDGKGWVYGYLIKDEYGHCYIFKYWFIPAISIPTERFIEVIPESIGQFTGLTDKNGIEIYEGDVCHILGGEEHQGYRELNEIGVITYSLSSSFDLVTDKQIHYSFSYCNIEEIEIIGNIHETK